MKTLQKPEIKKLEPKIPPTIQKCLCGCGGFPTRAKSSFVVGHDAKLKSQVIKGEKISDKATEYVQQRWPNYVDYLKQ